MRKPAELVYGVNERPPALVGGFVALQHVGTIAVNFVYPLLLARQAGLSADLTGDVLRLGMVALAVGVLVQALPRGPVGCHYLAPNIYPGTYLATGTLAIQAGGLPLFWGMTIVAGFATIVFSSIWHRLRTVIPSELAGLVVLLVGATIGVAALRLLHKPDGLIAPNEGMVTVTALVVMITLNVWSKGRLRTFSILIGIVAGYLAAFASGVLSTKSLNTLAHAPLFALPGVGHLRWSFDLSLFVPFVVTALTASVSSTAVVTTYQRITDANWVRPDMRNISQGICGDGIATMLAGLLGSFPVKIGPANAGLVAATGVASRVVAYPIAIILFLAAIMPPLTGFLIIMPPAVMAAGLLFPAAFIMMSGVQIISSRVLDSRRTIVIGTGILTFLLIVQSPGTFMSAPNWAKPIVASPLILATVIALTLNMIFRIGIKRSVDLQIASDSLQIEEIENFIERALGSWSAPRNVFTRLKPVVVQAVEMIAELCEPEQQIRLVMTYDEFDIVVKLTYRGEQSMFSDLPPSKSQIMEPAGHIRLGGYLIKRQADDVRTLRENGQTVLQIMFRQ